MGVFFTVYYAVMTAAPPVAGRLSDAAGTPGPALVFAALLFLAVLPTVWAFGALKSGGSQSKGRAVAPALEKEA